jgi:hypothetical protein
MSMMTRGAVAARLQQAEVGYFERDVFEVRSFWKEICVDVPDRAVHQHVCEEGKVPVEIRLHPFLTIYGRIWRIGGCTDCTKLFYYPIPLTEE